MANDLRIVHPLHENTIRVIEGRTGFPVNVVKPKEIAAFTVISQGPPGRTGDTGPAGNIAPPFFLLSNNVDYSTTSSITFNAPISSSLYPESGSSFGLFHSLGTSTYPWKDLYVGTGSIYFVNEGMVVSTLQASENSINIGSSFVTTSSFGFIDDPIIIKNSTDVSVKVTGSIDLDITDRDGIVIRSGSIEVFKVDDKGRVVLFNFINNPGAVEGGIFFSGSNFYVGI